jgi:hypothetical protein
VDEAPTPTFLLNRKWRAALGLGFFNLYFRSAMGSSHVVLSTPATYGT